MLDEAGYAKEGRIAVTQPRRVVSLCFSLPCYQHLAPHVALSAMQGRNAHLTKPSRCRKRACCCAQAALSVARRVAEEMDTDVGAEVGYSVRFDERISPRTRIVYLTGARPWQPQKCHLLLRLTLLLATREGYQL